jgi:O-antigen/teichoic acid export membrane protein
LAILGFYFIGRNGKYDLKVVVSALLIGALVQSVPPLLDTFRLLKPFLTRTRLRGTSIDFRSEMLPCFLNSNLSGYLKFAISPGDIFLLGLVSTPSQVALYGLAKQLTAPFAMVQTTMQTAITPEIVFLRAKHRLKQLEQLITRYVLTASFIGGISLVLALVIGTILFSSIFAEQYSNALTIFYVLVVAAWLLLVMAVFRPVAITMDQLKWHNAALATSLLLLVALLATRRLNALTLAFVQLVEAAMLRPAFGVVVWKKLRHQLREI